VALKVKSHPGAVVVRLVVSRLLCTLLCASGCGVSGGDHSCLEECKFCQSAAAHLAGPACVLATAYLCWCPWLFGGALPPGTQVLPECCCCALGILFVCVGHGRSFLAGAFVLAATKTVLIMCLHITDICLVIGELHEHLKAL